MKKIFFLSAVLTAFAVPSIALAQTTPKIFLNQVEITGVKGQSFKKVDIDIDAQGNVHIVAPQYQVAALGKESKPAPTAQAAAAKPAPQPNEPVILPNDNNPTALVALFDSPGLLGYNIEVSLNGKVIGTLMQHRAQATLDLSAHLKRGKNIIHYRPIMAADSGKSSRASVELFLSKQVASQGNQSEFKGAYGSMRIQSLETKSSYTLEFTVP